MKSVTTALDHYLQQWQLSPDGAVQQRPSSILLPVRQRNNTAAMLKINLAVEEQIGQNLLIYWQQQSGAARVIASDQNAILLERAEQSNLLATFSQEGKDKLACHIICSTVRQLHQPRLCHPPALPNLSDWFTILYSTAANYGDVLPLCAQTARHLLNRPQKKGSLHGDIHHSNILYFGNAGWLAIDPKGVYGEFTFDYANIFCNPDSKTACNPSLFRQRVTWITQAAKLSRQRLLLWIVAWCGLSASWLLEEGLAPTTRLVIAKLAANELGISAT